MVVHGLQLDLFVFWFEKTNIWMGIGEESKTPALCLGLKPIEGFMIKYLEMNGSIVTSFK